MKKIVNKINKKLNLSPRRIRDFYSNVISGIITGGLIGGFLTIIQSFTEVQYKFPTFLQLLVFAFMFLFLYLWGKRTLVKMTKNKDELKGYNSNIRAGFFASLFVTILLIFQNLWIRLFIIIPLTLVFVLLLWFLSGRKKRK